MLGIHESQVPGAKVVKIPPAPEPPVGGVGHGWPPAGRLEEWLKEPLPSALEWEPRSVYPSPYTTQVENELTNFVLRITKATMMKITPLSNIDPLDLSGGLWDNRELDAGLPTKIPANHPRFLAAINYIGFLFPTITETLLIPDEMSLRPAPFPTLVLFKTAEGPLNDSVDAILLMLYPDVSAMDIYRDLHHVDKAAPLMSFDAWMRSQQVIPSGPTGGIVGPLAGDDYQAIFGGPTYLILGNPSGLTKGQVVQEGGKAYTVATLNHPMGVRKFLVLKG